MSTKTVSSPTPGEVLRGIGSWFKVHPKIRYAVLFFIVCTSCYILNMSVAAADTETSSRAFNLPLVGVTDTDGVPIWRYIELPMDPGNGPMYVVRSIRYFIASILWAIYAMPILLMIAMVEYIVSFEWLSWLAAPFETVANGVGGVMEAWMLIPLALAVSALWIGFGYVRGRTGAATVEFVMVVLVFGVIASPAANPFDWMSGSGGDTASESGFIQQAADAGAEAGGMTINQDADPDNVTLSGSIVDITLRQTMLSMAFGSPLDGDCGDAWQSAATDPDNDAEDIREEVIDCDDEVADANQTDSFVWLFDLLLAIPAAFGVVFLLGVFLFFLLWQVLQAFISAVMAVIRAFLALFPGNSRTAWLNSIFQVLVSGVLIGVYIFALTLYMWGMGQLIEVIPAPLMQTGTILLGILIIIATITFWKMKKSGQKIGEQLAKAFGKTGLAKDSPEKQPSNFGSSAKNLGRSAVSKGIDMKQNARLLRATKTGLTTAAAVGTGGTAGVAAKAATSMAGNAAMGAATRGAKNQAGVGLPGVKGALPSGSVAPKGALPSGRPAATQIPSSASGTTPKSLPAATAQSAEPTTAAASHSAPQPVVSIPAPAGSENAPSSPLPPRETTSATGSPLTSQSAQSATAETATQAQRATNTSRALPEQTRAPQRVHNIPADRYGNNWVHKNGQVHRPVTMKPDGSPVQNIPQEEKVNRAFQRGDSWVTSPDVQNLKPSRSEQARRRQEPAPASPAQSSQRSQRQEGQRSAPMAMQSRAGTPAPAQKAPAPEAEARTAQPPNTAQRRTQQNTSPKQANVPPRAQSTPQGSTANRSQQPQNPAPKRSQQRPRPEQVDISARAQQASQKQPESQQRETPRERRPRNGGELRRGGRKD